MNRKLFLIPIFIAAQLSSAAHCFGSGSSARDSAQNYFAAPSESGDEDPVLSAVGAGYRLRYTLGSASEKLVDNRGNGHDPLYGVRNFRAVLNGVYYRGGANNVYNKHKKRSNMNPLPNEGLDNLCKEGFSQAIYLYTKNFGTAPKQTRCRTYEGNENTLEYVQMSPLDFNASDLSKMHTMIFDHVRNPRLGPIYAHCWNGWHSSGYLAATTLRQFCGFTADQAVAYWNTNTDGNNGSSYEGIRKRIRAFVPNPDLTLKAEEKAVLCPAPGSLSYVNN